MTEPSRLTAGLRRGQQQMRIGMQWVLARVLRVWVRPDVLPADFATTLPSDLPVLYVLETGGFADRAALDIVAARQQLPLPAAVLHYGDLSLQSSTVVLKPRARWWSQRRHQRTTDAFQRLLVTAQRLPESDCIVVPVSVYWGREPERQDSFWKLLFTENWELAGRLRKALSTLVHGRHTLLRFSEPLPLQTFVASGGNSVLLHRKLARLLRVHFRQRRIATLGPDLSHRRMLLRQVIADPDVRVVLASERQRQGGSIEKWQRRAQRYAHEIAADTSYRTVRLMHVLLSRLWTRLYDGVNVKGMHRLEAVAEGHEIVYLPCHRSHIDYLLLSYLLYVNGYSLPHIAAGINLNVPFVGGVLRRGGAFFLRRTFSGNRLYTAVFTTYLKELLQRGHALEYFIEGGRSRTGLLLPPKTGMLAMTVQAYIQDPGRPLVFVPVYFGYERLLEGRAFTSELAGGKKRKESLLGFLGSLKTLREDYGQVHVTFAEPIALDEVLDKFNPQWRPSSGDATVAAPVPTAGHQVLQAQSLAAKSETAAAPDTATAENSKPVWFRRAVSSLGRQSLQRINAAASVTPISLLATALLTTPKASMARAELELAMADYRQLILGSHRDTQVSVPADSMPAIIDKGLALGFVELRTDALGELVCVRRGQAAALTYFRNNILHLLALPSLLAAVFLLRRRYSRTRLQRLTESAWPYLTAELFLPDRITRADIDVCLQSLLEGGFLRVVDDDRFQRPVAGSREAGMLGSLAQLLQPTIERYYLAAAVLVAAPSTVTIKQLEQGCGQVAARLSQVHGRDPREWHDRGSLRALIDTLKVQGRLAVEQDCIKLVEDVTSLEIDMRQVLPDQVRHAIVSAVRQLPTPAA